MGAACCQCNSIKWSLSEAAPWWFVEESAEMTEPLTKSSVRAILTGQRNMQEILRPLVIPTLQQIGPTVVLQDVNAAPHRSIDLEGFQRLRATGGDYPNDIANSDLKHIEQL